MTPSMPAAPPLPDRDAVPEAPPAALPAPSDPLDLLGEVEIEVTVELGRRRIALAEVAAIEVGSVVELDTAAGEPLAIYANGRRIGAGEVVVVDGQLGVRIREIHGRTGA